MLCIVDIYIGKTDAEKTEAARELQALFEVCLPRAQREVKALPPLYSSGVRYTKQPPEACAFRPPSQVHERRGGDCKQLVLWRLAELRNAGVKATPRIIWLAEREGFSAHAQLRLPDGTIEDPSYILGMRGPL